MRRRVWLSARARAFKPVYDDREVVELFADEPELMAVVDALAATEASSSRRRRVAVGAVAAAVAVAAVVALLAPWAEHGPNVVDQALGAVGTADVFHTVVARDLPYDEHVDLASGASQPVRVTVETWVDARGGQVRSVIRHEGAIVADVEALPAARSVPGLTDRNAQLFATDYRAALAADRARVTRRGSFAGREAIWLQVTTAASSQEDVLGADTYRPLAFREVGTTDQAWWTVDAVESLPYRAADFATNDEPHGAEGGRVVAETPIALDALRRGGTSWSWTGETIAGFSFDSAAIQQLEPAGRGLVLRYRGKIGTVELSEAVRPEAAYGFTRGRFTFNLNPIPTGAVDIARVGRRSLGQLRSGDLYITIAASDREAVISVARALKPLR